MLAKLGHVDKVLLATKTNSAGEKVFDYIKSHVLAAKQTNGRLSTQFWVQFWEDYSLTWDVASELPEPEENSQEVIDEELIDAMQQARSKNPAERTPGPLSHFLESCGPMPAQHLYGVLNAVQAGPTLCQTHATKLQLSCLKYFARAGPL